VSNHPQISPFPSPFVPVVSSPLSLSSVMLGAHAWRCGGLRGGQESGVKLAQGTERFTRRRRDEKEAEEWLKTEACRRTLPLAKGSSFGADSRARQRASSIT
jgi:hypothetical protein